MKYATLPELLPRAKCVAECRRLSMPAARIADRAGWLQVAQSYNCNAQFGYAMTAACNFLWAASRMGDLQIAPAADWRPPLLILLAGRIACVTNVPRIAPAFAPDQEEHARRSEHHSLHIAVRERDRPDGSLRSMHFHLPECETGNAIAMN